MNPKVQIFTDGSCPATGKEGGWAYIIRLADGTEKRGSGGAKKTTNNKMELQGVIEALKLCVVPCDLSICSDSQYTTKGIAEWMQKWKRAGWKHKSRETGKWETVANLDLWMELDRLLQKHSVTTVWVQGHAGHVENEWCDQEAGRQTKLMKETNEQVPMGAN